MLYEMTPDVSFTLLEENIRRFWRLHGVPEAFRAAQRSGSDRTIALQPLVAAGTPSSEQMGLLVTADLIVRYQAMRGWPVRQRSGWICHGLPVELAVERALDPDLSGYDLSSFSAACSEVAIESVRKGEVLAERLAVWPDPDDLFLSLDPQAVGTVWGVLRRLWDGGQLKREYRVTPVCPRCATPLSSSEATRRTVDVESRSAWVRLPWTGEPDTYLLVWAPSPWMMVGMVALAANPGAEYLLVEMSSEEGSGPDQESARSGRLLVAEAALKRANVGDYRIVQRLRGRSLRGTHYHPPFTFVAVGSGAGQVLLSEDVPLDRGTGLCPVTPAFDAPSLALAQQHSLLIRELLDDWGALGDAVTPWRGLSPLDAEPLLLEDLRARGLLFDERTSAGQRALCPYCATPLLPMARSVWSVDTGGAPWIVSRERVWGVPLPVWECTQCGNEVCMSGLDDLARRAAVDVTQTDPHRPAVDRLAVPCERCGGIMRRVAEVLDASLESAILSNTSLPGPGAVSLAIGVGDERTGWLGDFARVAELLGEHLAWEQALAIPEGEAEAIWEQERHAPADAVRWATYVNTTPRRAERDFVRPLWRLMISLADSGVQDGVLDSATDELLDRWAVARLYQAARAATRALDAREPQQAAAELAALVGDLAEWYVPRRPGAGRELLEPLTLLLAPFVPHLAEAIHRQAGQRARHSVHLEEWPTLDPEWEDAVLLANMARVRHLGELGRQARAEAGIAPDQLLPGALVGSLAGATWSPADLQPFSSLLVDALGIVRVQLSPEAARHVEWRLVLDPGRPIQRDLSRTEIQAALQGLSSDQATHLATQLRMGMSVGLEVLGRAITLLPDEVSLSAQAGPNQLAAADDEHLVILAVGES